jgi:DNA-binding GntR family transcriptional regulator
VIELARRQALGVAMPSDWERVHDGISGKIASGAEGYAPGNRLPTIAGLAAEYATSQTTVKLALTLLGREGWTRGHQGKATFVADHPPIGDPPIE